MSTKLTSRLSFAFRMTRLRNKVEAWCQVPRAHTARNAYNRFPPFSCLLLGSLVLYNLYCSPKYRDCFSKVEVRHPLHRVSDFPTVLDPRHETQKPRPRYNHPIVSIVVPFFFFLIYLGCSMPIPNRTYNGGYRTCHERSRTSHTSREPATLSLP